MTFVGKVLVVVQVVLSLCFMAFAGAVYTVQQEWKTAHDKKVTELDAKTKELALRDEQISLLNKDLAATQAIQQNIQSYLDNHDQLLASQTGNDQVKNQLRVLTERIMKAEQEVSKLQDDKRGLEADLEASQQSFLQLQTANKKVVDEAKERAQEADIIKKINKDLNNQVVAYQDKIFNLEDLLFNLETDAQAAAGKQKSLLVKVAYLQDVIRREGINEEEALAKDEPPPLVGGKVVATKPATRGQDELVEINLGSNDGLSVGHTLQIFSLKGKGQYLAEIKLVLVEDDAAVGKVILKTKNGQIERGDNVTTKL
jgi:uncharacterized phage infection (PIP) family protein YhgE